MLGPLSHQRDHFCAHLDHYFDHLDHHLDHLGFVNLKTNNQQSIYGFIERRLKTILGLDHSTLEIYQLVIEKTECGDNNHDVTLP